MSVAPSGEKGTVPVRIGGQSPFSSRATPNDEHTRVHPLLGSAAEPTGDGQGFANIMTQGEQAAAAAAHRTACRSQGRQPTPDLGESRAEPFGRRLQPVVQPAADFLHISLLGGPAYFSAHLRL